MLKDLASIYEKCKESCQGFLDLRHENPADFWHSLLYAAFWLLLALYPIGYGFREVISPVCLVFLLFYYRYAWGETVVSRLRPLWLFGCAALMIIIGIVFSIHPWSSLLHAGTGVNKGFILPFIAMECVRSPKDLKNLIWACVFACFWEGIDGIWQAGTGHDFIMGYTLNAHRLTGSLGDYTVGNYIALALVPSLGIWYVLREQMGRISSIFLFSALLWPAVFLLQGAAARSGVLALASSVFFWELLTRGWQTLRLVVYPATIMLGFYFFQFSREAVLNIVEDNRWDLWRLAWRVFMEHPWLGAGAGQYNTAFREMGLAPVRESITISHPHDLYLDLLYAHGIIGFSLGMIFLFGFLFWGIIKIMPNLRSGALYWRLTTWVWLGYLAWLINGIFGHDFYRIWWLGLAMSYLGMMIGAVVNGKMMTPGSDLQTTDSSCILPRCGKRGEKQ